MAAFADQKALDRKLNHCVPLHAVRRPAIDHIFVEIGNRIHIPAWIDFPVAMLLGAIQRRAVLTAASVSSRGAL